MTHLHALCSVFLIFGYLSKISTCTAITTKSVEFLEHKIEQIEKRIERRSESTINGLKRGVELLKKSGMHSKPGGYKIGF